ncbi:unnamed protein product, partial [Prorocentrum cordatum]
MSAAGPDETWSKCGACGRREHNAIFVERDRRRKCGRQVELFKPKKPASAGTARSNELKNDPLLKKLLSDEIAKPQTPQATPPQSQGEALRRASGAWRDASLKHDQAINAAVKVQAAWHLAAQGMAAKKGLVGCSEASKEEVKGVLFEVRGCAARKHSQVKSWNERATALRAKIDQRLSKKRRQDGDDAVAGGGRAAGGSGGAAAGASGASGGPAAPAAGAAARGAAGGVAKADAASAEAQRAQEAADRISAAKLAAARAAKQAHEVAAQTAAAAA